MATTAPDGSTTVPSIVPALPSDCAFIGNYFGGNGYYPAACGCGSDPHPDGFVLDNSSQRVRIEGNLFDMRAVGVLTNASAITFRPNGAYTQQDATVRNNIVVGSSTGGALFPLVIIPNGGPGVVANLKFIENLVEPGATGGVTYPGAGGVSFWGGNARLADGSALAGPTLNQ